MPGTLVTCSLLCAASQLESWMSWMRSGPGSPSPVSPPPPALAAPGVGAPAAKSLALLSVSAASLRCTESLFEAPPIGAVSLMTAVVP
jgi:hypothetical protein